MWSGETFTVFISLWTHLFGVPKIGCHPVDYLRRTLFPELLPSMVYDWQLPSRMMKWEMLHNIPTSKLNLGWWLWTKMANLIVCWAWVVTSVQ